MQISKCSRGSSNKIVLFKLHPSEGGGGVRGYEMR